MSKGPLLIRWTVLIVLRVLHRLQIYQTVLENIDAYNNWDEIEIISRRDYVILWLCEFLSLAHVPPFFPITFSTFLFTSFKCYMSFTYYLMYKKRSAAILFYCEFAAGSPARMPWKLRANPSFLHPKDFFVWRSQCSVCKRSNDTGWTKRKLTALFKGQITCG